jgi:hypothetical protein
MRALRRATIAIGDNVSLDMRLAWGVKMTSRRTSA